MNEPTQPLVGIVVGSASDVPTIRKGTAVLEELGIPYELKICSAHRTPARAIALWEKEPQTKASRSSWMPPSRA